eukprot:11126948-Prorocentrum_lima.AAC.1
MYYIPHNSSYRTMWQDICLKKPDDSNPTIQQWLTVEDPDGQNMWTRKRWSYPKVCTVRDRNQGL